MKINSTGENFHRIKLHQPSFAEILKFFRLHVIFNTMKTSQSVVTVVVPGIFPAQGALSVTAPPTVLPRSTAFSTSPPGPHTGSEGSPPCPGASESPWQPGDQT